MSNNNNANDYNERQGRVLELYDQGKSYSRHCKRAKDITKRHQRHFKKESSQPWDCNNG